jgi:hypothetical protein
MCHRSLLSHTSRRPFPRLIIHLSLATYPFPSMSSFCRIKLAPSIHALPLCISLMTPVNPSPPLSPLIIPFFVLAVMAPSFRNLTPLPALASITVPQSYSVIPGGNVRGLPYPEVLSWPGLPQSQGAVIEAVGGG